MGRSFFKELTDQLPPDISQEVRSTLVTQLEPVLRSLFIPRLADSLFRPLVKGIDAMINVAAKNLDTAKERAFHSAHIDQIAAQWGLFLAALQHYIPAQRDVAKSVSEKGEQAPETDAHRKVRDTRKATLREAFINVILALSGGRQDD